INNDAEVETADRQQIGGFSTQDRDDHGKEQRHWNGRRHDQCGTQIAEEHPLNDKDQHHTEQHVIENGTHGDCHKVTAVVEGLDTHTGRQGTVGIHSCHTISYARHHVHRALELLHQHDAGHDVGRIIASGDAEPRGETDLHFGHVRDHHRKAALLAQHDIADILKRSHNSDAADIHRLFTHRDRPAAHVGIVGGDRVDNLRYRDTEGPHAIEVDLGLKFLSFAAEHQHVGH